MLITLLATVLNNQYHPLVSAFRARFPEFDAVTDERVSYWLYDAERYVSQTMYGTNYVVALLLAAAHQIAMASDGGFGSDMPSGITAMRSGALSLSFDAQSVRDQASGGWSATRYGAQFLALLKLTTGGPRVTSGTFGACGTGYLSGLHPSF